MDLIIWAKTLLTVQKYHERMIGALKALIKKRALASIHNGSENQAITVSNDILKMLKRKENLATLSLLTLKALASINSESANILICSFFDEKSKEQIATELGFCERTAYRKMVTALKEFSSYVSGLGYTPQNLCKICETEKWIENTYQWVQQDSCAKNCYTALPVKKVFDSKEMQL